MSIAGTAKRIPSNVNFSSPTTPQITDYESMTDTTEAPPYSPHWMSKYRTYIDPPYVNGTVPYGYPGGGSVQFTNYATINRTAHQYAPTLSTFVDGAYWTTKALAGLNPDRPTVDLPLFLFELREFPRMLQGLGNVLRGRVRPSDVPGGHLAYEFGWKPLVSDLGKLADLTNQSRGRQRYLAGLTKGRRVRRNLVRGHVIQDVTSTDGYIHFNVGPAGDPWALKADIRTREEVDIWFSCRVQSTNRSSPLTNLKDPPESWARWLQNTGLSSIRPATLWNATPWSWLSDYYLNLGDVIEATHGMQSLRIDDFCLMRHQRITSRLSRVRTKTGLSVSQNFMTREGKYRTYDPFPLPLPAPTPWLSQRQMGILGSLATASALRAFRL